MSKSEGLKLLAALCCIHCSDLAGQCRRGLQERNTRIRQSLLKLFSGSPKPPKDVVCPRCATFENDVQQLICSDPLSAIIDRNHLRGHRVSVPKTHISVCPVCRFFQRLGYAGEKDPHFPSLEGFSGETFDFQLYLLPLVSSTTIFVIGEKEAMLPAVRSNSLSDIRHIALGVGHDALGATRLQFSTRILERGLILPHNTEPGFGPDYGIPFLQVAKVNHSAVDYSSCRRWLSRCQSEHFACHQAMATRTSSLSIKCIDCESPEFSVVIIDDSTDYVALSYVWGNPTLSEKSKKKTPVSQVVQDAMTVTTNIGKRYLWVDQYCVEQQNHDIKALEIQAMDQIYAGAYVTIVACAGSDSTAGLPGVSSRARIKQPHVQISPKISLVSAFPPLYMAVRDSTWMQRGWTYQEAVLSRRTLFFTEFQVYYTCSGMRCSESLPVPEEPRIQMCGDSGTSRYRLYDQAVSNLLPPSADFIYRSPGTKPEAQLSSLDIMRDHIVRYTSRKLSYPEDILNALCGLLTRSPFLTFWGVPIALHDEPADLDTITERDLVLGFLRNLFWFPERAKEGYDNDSLLPREGFPSWSWAGWRGGRIQYHYRMTRRVGEHRHTVRDEPATPLVVNLDRSREIKIWLESDGGEGQTFTDLLQQRARGQMILPELTPYIYIETLVIRVRFNGAFSMSKPWFLCGCHPASVHPRTLHFESTTIWPSPVFDNRRKYPDCIENRDWDCVLLFIADNPHWEAGSIWVFLIVEWNAESDTAYRVGSIAIADRPDYRTHPDYSQNRPFIVHKQWLERFPDFNVQRDLLNKIPCTRRSLRLG